MFNKDTKWEKIAETGLLERWGISLDDAVRVFSLFSEDHPEFEILVSFYAGCGSVKKSLVAVGADAAIVDRMWDDGCSFDLEKVFGAELRAAMVHIKQRRERAALNTNHHVGEVGTIYPTTIEGYIEELQKGRVVISDGPADRPYKSQDELAAADSPKEE